MNENESQDQPTLQATAWVLSKLDDFISNGGGTFRHLIYDTMGYDPEAYFALYPAGGMNITNFIHEALEMKEINKELLAACVAAAGWTGLDGDGIDEPVLNQLRQAITKAREE